MSLIKDLLADVVTVTAEEAEHDLENKSGGSFINECGVYDTTIEQAFMTKTKKGGIALNLHFRGANTLDSILYIVSKKGGKLVTTCNMGGKTVSLPSFKLFKQLYFVATREGLDLAEMKTKVETIKYKSYGKDVEVEAETIVGLIGKEVKIGVRLAERYAYEDGETIKSELATDKDGNTRYDKELDSVFSKEGFDAMEIIKEDTETKALESKIKFLSSDKAIKTVKLEAPEVEEEDDDELAF